MNPFGTWRSTKRVAQHHVRCRALAVKQRNQFQRPLGARGAAICILQDTFHCFAIGTITRCGRLFHRRVWRQLMFRVWRLHRISLHRGHLLMLRGRRLQLWKHFPTRFPANCIYQTCRPCRCTRICLMRSVRAAIGTCRGLASMRDVFMFYCGYERGALLTLDGRCRCFLFCYQLGITA